jgi:hypothetical protein
LDSAGIGETFLGRFRIPSAKVEAAQLMLRPGLTGAITGRAGRTNRGAERVQEIEPAEGEKKEAVKCTRESKLLVKTAASIEPTKQLEQAVNLAHENVTLEQAASRGRAKEFLGALDAVCDGLAAGFHMFDVVDERRFVWCFERLGQSLRMCSFASSLVLRKRT